MPKKRQTYTKRTPDEIKSDQTKIAELYMLGWRQVEIATHLNISEVMVSRDLDAIRAEWQKSALHNFDEARGRELARLEMIEQEAWAAWEKSKKESVTVKTKSWADNKGSDTDNNSTAKDSVYHSERREAKSSGDPRYMEIILKCSEQRSKLLGLVVTKVDMTTAGKPMQQIQLVEVRSSDDRNLPQSIIQ